MTISIRCVAQPRRNATLSPKRVYARIIFSVEQFTRHWQRIRPCACRRIQARADESLTLACASCANASRDGASVADVSLERWKEHIRLSVISLFVGKGVSICHYFDWMNCAVERLGIQWPLSRTEFPSLVLCMFEATEGNQSTLGAPLCACEAPVIAWASAAHPISFRL